MRVGQKKYFKYVTENETRVFAGKIIESDNDKNSKQIILAIRYALPIYINNEYLKASTGQDILIKISNGKSFCSKKSRYEKYSLSYGIFMLFI